MEAAFAALDESERPAMYFEELRELFDVIWESSASEVVKGGTLDTAALDTMLTGLKDMSDKYKLAADDSGSEMSAGIVICMSSGGRGMVSFPPSAVWYMQGRADYGAFMVNALPLLAFQMERSGTAFAPFPGLKANSFVPVEIAGISADTKVKDLAVGFIRAMLGQSAQSVTSGSGLPVTEQGMREQIDAYNEMMKESGAKPVNMELVSMAQSLSQPVFVDDVLTETVWAETEKLCKGEVDIAKAVTNIEQSVKNYLAERA
jgi:ABC-type glycerol-3-phosphate transport system substrate-binding protein